MKLVLFGAGKIGRSFIGEVFSNSGYEVVFLDINKRVIDALNERHGYDVVIKGDHDQVIHVRNVRGVSITDRESVLEELASADIAAVSVGKDHVLKLAEPIAKALEMRYARGCGPLDLIIAENMRDSAHAMREALSANLLKGFPVDKMIGLVETSIGKMVPIMPREEEERDPLLVYAEAYRNLIVDGKAFKNPLPKVDALAPKENIGAWVDRKSFIHNLGHAAASYAAYVHDPSLRCVYEALEVDEIRSFVRSTMMESAHILMKKYPGEFTPEQLEQHVDDLLHRFSNVALGDTIYRVGCDLPRKLASDDRVVAPILEGFKQGMPVENLITTLASGYLFRAVGANGQLFPNDGEFVEDLDALGFEAMLEKTSGITDPSLKEMVKAAYERLSGRAVDVEPFIPGPERPAGLDCELPR